MPQLKSVRSVWDQSGSQGQVYYYTFLAPRLPRVGWVAQVLKHTSQFTHSNVYMIQHETMSICALYIYHHSSTWREIKILLYFIVQGIYDWGSSNLLVLQVLQDNVSVSSVDYGRKNLIWTHDLLWSRWSIQLHHRGFKIPSGTQIFSEYNISCCCCFSINIYAY